jgi:hypothetical protein
MQDLNFVADLADLLVCVLVTVNISTKAPIVELVDSFTVGPVC